MAPCQSRVSRVASSLVLQAVTLILNTVIALVIAAMASHGVTVKVPPLNFSRDVRTAYKTHFHEPEIKREMRCPTCLNKISCPKDQIILTCPWLPHPNARKPCGADLWKPLLNRKGEKVPACLVTTQTIQSMLPSFLSRKVIDDALHETHQKQDDNLDSRDVTYMIVRVGEVFMEGTAALTILYLDCTSTNSKCSR